MATQTSLQHAKFMAFPVAGLTSSSTSTYTVQSAFIIPPPLISGRGYHTLRVQLQALLTNIEAGLMLDSAGNAVYVAALVVPGTIVADAQSTTPAQHNHAISSLVDIGWVLRQGSMIPSFCLIGRKVTAAGPTGAITAPMVTLWYES